MFYMKSKKKKKKRKEWVYVDKSLSWILSQAESDGRLSDIKITKIYLRISHLMYADDLVVYSKTKVEEARKVVKFLTTYCE